MRGGEVKVNERREVREAKVNEGRRSRECTEGDEK